MKTAFYPKLAFLGIKKNRKLYLPYILSCIGMVMMGYIVQSLSYSPVLKQMRGGSNMEAILSIGKFVIAIFSLLFLFYTNSFLVRRRFKEFGLYSILGMGKNGIAKIVLFESLFSAFFGLAGGIGLGILFSKFAELGLLNAIKAPIDYSLHLSGEAISFTAMVFGIIFILITIKSLITVAKCNPLELLRKENLGEKPPKTNWVLAVAGAVLLISAYIISVTIESPLSALSLFFVAVIMVIAATYMLFVSGSVALCGILRKNKKYYYKKNHFVSVSSMSYRMKRNGAGLASIRILATM
ncbi:MAG: FtsX-like permease family protein, partial [Clostridiales bacterium]|nr:FtsX-like permease family protein [Candidatus Equinaster intestinalis]